MNIYLATPVNGRKEKTIREKKYRAYERICEMERYLKKKYHDAEFMSSFNLISLLENNMMPESLIMGSCVRMVMECDMIVLDDGWENSQGCTVERFVAMQYGKKVQTMNYFKLRDKIG